MADHKTTTDVRILQKELSACTAGDEAKIIKIFKQLSKLPVSVAILQATGIGKQVHKYRKCGGRLADYSKSIVNQWKQVLRAEAQINEQHGHEDQESHSSQAGSSTEDVQEEKLQHHHSESVATGGWVEDRTSEKRDAERMRAGKHAHEKTTEKHKSRKETHREAMKKEGVQSPVGRSSSELRTPSEQPAHQKSPKKDPGKKKAKVKVRDAEVSFESSGMSFADCLNLDLPQPKKMLKLDKVKTTIVPSTSAATEFDGTDRISGKRKDKKKHKHKHKDHERSEHKSKHRDRQKSEHQSSGHTSNDLKRKLEMPTADDPKAKKAKDMASPVDISLPSINPDYKPLRLPQIDDLPRRRTAGLDEAALTTMSTTSKQSRTKVFSGKARNVIYDHVPSLYDMCMRVLCDNIDALEDVGGIPYSILQPVLEKCTVEQLLTLEDFNPHFLEDSDELWHKHSLRDFKNEEPDEFETWRDLYLRKLDERRARLEKITANIAANMAQKKPERQLKLAYMSGPAKPPRSIQRQQAKLGTASPGASQHESPRKNSSSSSSHRPFSNARPGGSHGSGHSSHGSSQGRAPKTVKMVAPMMMKSLKMMKRLKR